MNEPVIIGIDATGAVVAMRRLGDAIEQLGLVTVDARRAVEATGRRLPRSFNEFDAMHWTPPADDVAVPPCLA